jgi:hypothetical protein
LVWHASYLALAQDQQETGLALARQYLAACDAHPNSGSRRHLLTGALLIWAAISHQLGDWNGVQQYAETALHYARDSQRVESQYKAQLWLALSAYQMGQPTSGAAYFANAMFTAQRLVRHASHDYQVLWQLYEQRGETAQIDPLFQQAIAETVRGGEIYGECVARLIYACWLGQSGQAPGAALADAHHAARQLRQPASYLAKVARVAQGDYDHRMIW